jgi:hypothetical protein
LSSPAALATVTATLQNILSGVTPSVTTQPPSIARNGGNGEQINIFLYSTHYNTAFSNSPMPHQAHDGERTLPPLPLVLNYLVTAYGLNDDDISGQQLMGRAMSVLHDHPLLGKSDIEGITPNSQLQDQIERIRITPETLTLDDMSKLWSSFQSAEYRLSTGYQVSVVLIESTRPTRTPLPVLKRGSGDEGVFVQASLIPPFPSITGLELPDKQPNAMLGDTLILNGHHLKGDSVTVRFTHPDLPAALIVSALAGSTDTRVSVQIPNNPVAWTSGLYSIEVIIVKAGEQDRVTNVLSFSLAPRILTIAPPNPIPIVAGDATITMTFSPEVRPDQRASLLLGDREVLANDHPVATGSLVFVVEDAPSGDRHVRLRIDGVDSLLVDRTATPPVYEAAMLVTIA